MKPLRYLCLLSLAVAAAMLLLGILAGYSTLAAEIVDSYARVLFVIWAFLGVIIWVGGFVVIAKHWHSRTTARNLLSLFLLFSLNVFFAYFLILRARAPLAPEERVPATRVVPMIQETLVTLTFRKLRKEAGHFRA